MTAEPGQIRPAAAGSAAVFASRYSLDVESDLAFLRLGFGGARVEVLRDI